MSDDIGWTRHRLMRELRAAGWKRIQGPAAVYVSPGGARFHMDKYAPEFGGVAWRMWARAMRLPPGGATENQS